MLFTIPLTRHLPRVLSGAVTYSVLFAAASLFASESATQATGSPVTVELKQDAQGHWQLLRNGEPFEVHGIGREADLDLALQIGANAVRTYHSPTDEKRLSEGRAMMDEAYGKGLLYLRGLVVQRERAGVFSYKNPADLEKQRKHIREQVRAWKDHPGVLVWGLGNEAEGPSTRWAHPEFWKELEVLAQIVKDEDPSRPVMTVLAGSSAWKLKAVRDYCPSIDLLGINSYGGAVNLPERLDIGGWDKPFMLTEFGPLGHWEVPKTDWGAPIEPRSEDKAALYGRGYLGSKADPSGRFLGAVCFTWGNKQEITSTWYGMFLKSGEKTPAVDAIGHVYSGKWLPNRSPRIQSFTSDIHSKRVPAGAVFTATIEADDAEGDPLAFEWVVMEERKGGWGEGAHERVPATVEGVIESVREDAPGRSTVTLRMPEKPGAYRLFAYVRDGQGGGATENIPFFVQNSQP